MFFIQITVNVFIFTFFNFQSQSDIRKYFSAQSSAHSTKEKKRKKIIESDDEEDPLPTRKSKVILSDSGWIFFNKNY